MLFRNGSPLGLAYGLRERTRHTLSLFVTSYINRRDALRQRPASNRSVSSAYSLSWFGVGGRISRTLRSPMAKQNAKVDSHPSRCRHSVNPSPSLAISFEHPRMFLCGRFIED